jgi:hypothetical protein
VSRRYTGADRRKRVAARRGVLAAATMTAAAALAACATPADAAPRIVSIANTGRTEGRSAVAARLRVSRSLSVDLRFAQLRERSTPELTDGQWWACSLLSALGL